MDSHLYHSPIGDLELFARAGRLLKIRFADQYEAFEGPTEQSRIQDPVLDLTCKQLDEYFYEGRRKFDIPIALQGTPFQLSVWSILYRIPFGKKISYRDLAMALGKQGASRAVGSANAANPLPIIVPCHRVIASDGSLAGFAGGVDVKRSLLDHECAGAGLFAAAMN